MVISGDRFGRPNVRVQFVTDDNAVVLLHYTGLVERTDAFKTAHGWERSVYAHDHALQYRSRKYCWLNDPVRRRRPARGG